MERRHVIAIVRRFLPALLILVLLVMGCGEDENQETATRGHLIVTSAETTFPFVERCAVAFQTTYQKAYIDIQRSTSREALVALSNGESRLAVLSRDLNEMEKEDLKDIAEQQSKYFRSDTVAYDAVPIIVNGDNPVEQLSFSQLKAIYTGKITNWKEIGGEDRRIIPLVRNRNSGTYELFQDRVLSKEEYGTTVYPCSTMVELTRIVEYEPGAIGGAGMMMIQRGNLKAIAISESDDGPYVIPSQQSILEKRYPLRHPVVICYFRTRSMDLVKGFVSYLMDAKGQSLAVRQGIVPATMPVRVVEMK